MNKIFAEYRVGTDQRDAYLEFVEELRGLYARVQVYEGIHQPGLFVEEWSDYSESFYEELQAERNEVEHPFWQRLEVLIEGGRAKENLWIFRKI